MSLLIICHCHWFEQHPRWNPVTYISTWIIITVMLTCWCVQRGSTQSSAHKAYNAAYIAFVFGFAAADNSSRPGNDVGLWNYAWIEIHISVAWCSIEHKEILPGLHKSEVSTFWILTLLLWDVTGQGLAGYNNLTEQMKMFMACLAEDWWHEMWSTAMSKCWW